jgi:hypothetical protein
MNLKNISKVVLVCATLLLIMPNISLGYFATQRTATRVTNETALYSIDFSFGFAEKDVYIPVMTERTEVNDITNPLLGYTFTTSETGDTQAGTAVGLVLSDMPIVNNMYKVSAGHRGHFTLVVALSLDETDPKAKYGLQVTNLPFLIDQKEGLQRRGLNIHELGIGKPGLFAYHTKEIGLNK